jgi:hypothetical protein
VLSGRTFDGAGALPFHPFTEALDAYAAHPAVDLLVHPPASSLRADELRSRLLDGVARFLVDRAAAAPVVLTVDDLHWADDGTVAMLRHIARNAAGRRLLVVGTYRPGEESDAFADALGALRSETECSVLRLVRARPAGGRAAGGRDRGCSARGRPRDRGVGRDRRQPVLRP